MYKYEISIININKFHKINFIIKYHIKNESNFVKPYKYPLFDIDICRRRLQRYFNTSILIFVIYLIGILQ